MYDRTASHLDLPSIPIPSAGLVGFAGDECWPVYRVSKADWDSMKDFWPKRKSMTKLEVIRRNLKDVSQSLAEITGSDGDGTYTPEFRERATRIAVKVHDAIAACDKQDGEGAPY